MRQYEIKGTIMVPGQPTAKFEQVITAMDRSSAVRLINASYQTPTGKVYINDVKDLGPAKK